jgi:hypothetical protein
MRPTLQPSPPFTNHRKSHHDRSKGKRAKFLKAEWIEEEDDDDLMCLGIEESKWPEYNSFSSLFHDSKADLVKSKANDANSESFSDSLTEKSAESSTLKLGLEDVDKYFRHSPTRETALAEHEESAASDRKTDVKSDADSKKKEADVAHPVRLKKLYLCGVCEKSFELAAQLRKHASKYKHKNSVRCAQCRDKFSATDDLVSHIKGQHSEKTMKCHQCAAAFVTERDLKRHQTTHGMQKMYR